MNTTPTPYVSIVIPVHNQTHLVQKLLRSIFDEAMPAGSFEIIITDDGSQPPVPVETPAMHAGTAFRLIRHETSKGAAAARNTAAAEARGEVLFFLDADTILEPGSLKRVHDRFHADPQLGAVNGGGAADPANPEEGFTPRYRALIDHIQQNRRAPGACTFFTPRCGAMRKKIFDDCGRFDPAFPGASVEEYEFGHRLGRLTPIAFDGQINVLHHYQKFRKNCRNYYSRVRFWMPLFWRRRKFENFGATTGSYGVGSVFGVIAGLLLPFVCACWSVAAAFIVSFGIFLSGYWELFSWTFRLKGLFFLIKSVLLSWWLCIFITAGALAGTWDAFVGGDVQS